MLRLVRPDNDLDRRDGPFPFPVTTARHAPSLTDEELGRQLLGERGTRPEDILRVIDRESRRMKDLARELGCLGNFDAADDDGGNDDDDRPRAA